MIINSLMINTKVTCALCIFRSAPELGNNNGQLRKTQSQPQPCRANSTVTAATTGKTKESLEEAHKHSRCKSVPTPLHEVANQKTADGAGAGLSMSGGTHELSCPNSPTECSNNIMQDLDNKNKKSSASFNSSCTSESDSAKPQKTIMEGFRNNLKKSKNEGNGKLDSSYANSWETEESNIQENLTPPSKSNGAERLDNEQNVVSGYQNSLS